MNTFLPFPSFLHSARILDRARLGKQRIECVQLLKALTDPSAGYQNHPATTMWRRHAHALASYGLHICEEWVSRGYNDNCAEQIYEFFPSMPREIVKMKLVNLRREGLMPWWFGWRAFHSSHKSNLLRKDRQHYAEFLPVVPESLPYVWPSDEPRVFKRQHSKDSPYYVKLPGYSSAPPTSRSQ